MVFAFLLKNCEAKEMKKSKSYCIVRCSCRDEILLLPDLKEMGKAIDDHVELHLQNKKAPRCTTAGAERLKDMLIAQVFKAIIQSKEEENLKWKPRDLFEL
jgi:hypothetical protein